MPKTLLLADDSVTIQKVVGISFANEDVVLLTVDNGDDAIAKAREARPDLVLADVVMPGKSGYEVCEAVKSDASLAGVPVLLLTGTFEAFDEERAQRVGADGHITKPFEAQALVDQVNALLARSATAAPAAAAPTPGSAADESLGLPRADESVEFFDDETTAPGTTAAGDTAPAIAAAAAPAPVAADALGLDDSAGQSFRFDDTPDLGAALEAPPEPAGTPAPGTPTSSGADETRILPAGVAFAGPDAETIQAGELEAEPVFDALDETTPPTANPTATPTAPGTTLDPAQARAYDVSSTDLGPVVAPPAAEVSSAPPPIPTMNFDETVVVSEPMVAAPEPVAPPPIPQAPVAPAPVAEAPPPAPVAAPVAAAPEPQPIAQPTAPPATAAAVAGEISAEARDEIRATLEKVAWEAFGSVTESVVKEAVARIEKVAWEVVPQLAEVLVREEIRRLKDQE